MSNRVQIVLDASMREMVNVANDENVPPNSLSRFRNVSPIENFEANVNGREHLFELLRRTAGRIREGYITYETSPNQIRESRPRVGRPIERIRRRRQRRRRQVQNNSNSIRIPFLVRAPLRQPLSEINKNTNVEPRKEESSEKLEEPQSTTHKKQKRRVISLVQRRQNK
ncbi:unnamed protein product [Caenorhabditis angaria]|uniref:Uncharacterized protein n=1 Tax=Caenorhabditis angaria TaxID=860376 RepID=A0A9P1N8R5_9PELO|nr:unnamed protein product [Caenorhabditis angaria]